MSGYRGRGSSAGSHGVGARYFQHDFQNGGEALLHRRPPSEGYNRPYGGHYSTRWTSTYHHHQQQQQQQQQQQIWHDDGRRSNRGNYGNQLSSPSEAVELTAAVEPVRPGPNAKRNTTVKSSPVSKLRIATTSTGSSSTTSTATTTVDVLQRKAFDAKRFKNHSESEGNGSNQHIIFNDGDDPVADGNQSTYSVNRSCKSTVLDTSATPSSVSRLLGDDPLTKTAEKLKTHIATVDSELMQVDAEIVRLQAKRAELTKQRATLADVLSTIADKPVDTFSVPLMVPPSVSPAVSDTALSALSAKRPVSAPRPELQCPEVSTHSQNIVSPESEKLTVPKERNAMASSQSVVKNLIQNEPLNNRSIVDETSASTAASKNSAKRKHSASSRDVVSPNVQQSSIVLSQQMHSNSTTPVSTAPSNDLAVVPGTVYLAFRDIDSGNGPRGVEDDTLLVTCFVSVVGDPDLLLIGNKSGHVCKYSLLSQSVSRKEFIFRKAVTALCGVISDNELRIFVGGSDGDYRCYNSNLSEVIHSNRFGWGVTSIKYLLNHVYIGIGNGLVSIVNPKNGRILERFSCGCSYIYDIEALQESARDTIVCSLKTSDHLSVRDASDGLQLRTIELPRLMSSSPNEFGIINPPTNPRQVNGATSPLACTHLACAGGFIFGCQANGQLLAVIPGERRATVLANLDSRPVALSVIGLNSSNGIYVAVITADAIVRVFLVSSSMPIGAVMAKKKRSTAAKPNLRSRMPSSSSDSDSPEPSIPSSQITYGQVFHASMASQGWTLRLAAFSPTGFICLISYPTAPNPTAPVSPPYVLEVYGFPKMLNVEKS